MGSRRSKKLNKPLYEPLPDDMEIDEHHTKLEEFKGINSIHDFVTPFLPADDALKIDTNLKNAVVPVNLNPKFRKKAKHRKRKCALSQKERRELGLFRLPKLGMTYVQAMAMNKLWQDYMRRFLNLDNIQEKEWYNPKNGNLWDQMNTTILKADYHGARLRVHSSLCNSMVGIEGIIVVDTKFTFVVIGKDDVARTLPKESCIFEVFLLKYKFKIFGKYFCIRPSERSTKKIKCPFIPSL